MPYSLTLTETAGYVHFRVAGENTPENVQGHLLEVYQVCVARGYEAILIEESLVGPSLGLLDVFRIIAEASPRTVAKIRAIAFVDTQPDHSAEKMAFAEDVAVNRRVNVRRFADLGAAETWLRQTQSQTG